MAEGGFEEIEVEGLVELEGVEGLEEVGVDFEGVEEGFGAEVVEGFEVDAVEGFELFDGVEGFAELGVEGEGLAAEDVPVEGLLEEEAPMGGLEAPVEGGLEEERVEGLEEEEVEGEDLGGGADFEEVVELDFEGGEGLGGGGEGECFAGREGPELALAGLEGGGEGWEGEDFAPAFGLAFFRVGIPTEQSSTESSVTVTNLKSTQKESSHLLRTSLQVLEGLPLFLVLLLLLQRLQKDHLWAFLFFFQNF